LIVLAMTSMTSVSPLPAEFSAVEPNGSIASISGLSARVGSVLGRLYGGPVMPSFVLGVLVGPGRDRRTSLWDSPVRMSSDMKAADIAALALIPASQLSACRNTKFLTLQPLREIG